MGNRYPHAQLGWVIGASVVGTLLVVLALGPRGEALLALRPIAVVLALVLLVFGALTVAVDREVIRLDRAGPLGRVRHLVTIASLGIAVLGSLLVCSPSPAVERDLLDDFWERSAMEPDPTLGGVLRADFDIDDDGQLDLLLSNSQRMGSSGWAEWYAYRAVGDHQLRCIGTVPAAPDSFRVLADPARVEVLAFTRPDEGDLPPSLESYGVSATAVTFLSAKPLDDAAAEAMRKSIAEWRQAVRFRVLWAELDDEGRLVSPTWTVFKTNEPAGDVMNLEGLVVVE
jgi:hypothetical protein